MFEDDGSQSGLTALLGDLVGVGLLTVLTGMVVFLPVLADTPVRTGLGLGFVLFAPGYVLVAVLFPGAGTPETGGGSRSTTTRSGVDGPERLVLSVGTSVALAALTSLVLGLVRGGIGTASVFLVLGTLTLVGLVPAARRRLQVPPGRRFHPGVGAAIDRLRSGLLEPATPLDATLNVALVVLLVVVLVSVGTGAPETGEDDGRLTEFYLLAPDENGTYVPEAYPSSLAADGTDLAVVIDNQERERRTYTVVVVIQRVSEPGGAMTVTGEAELDRFRQTLAAGETARIRHTITPPSMTGRDLRLVYLLYVDDPPADPTVENAYRELHLWVDVPASSTALSSPARDSPEYGTIKEGTEG